MIVNSAKFSKTSIVEILLVSSLVINMMHKYFNKFNGAALGIKH